MKESDFGFSSRRRFSSAARSRLLARYERSGLTQRGFVQQHGLSLATLTKWLRQERQRATPPRKISSAFQPVDLSGVLGAPSWTAEVVLPDGFILRLSAQASAALAGQLLEALRRPC